MDSNTPKFPRILRTLVVLFMLVGFPLGSYIYLKKGFDYQKAALNDLRKSHQWSQWETLTLVQGKLAPDGKTPQPSHHLLGLVPPGAAIDMAAFHALFKRLYEQFDDNENLTVTALYQLSDSAQMASFMRDDVLLEDPLQVHFRTVPDADYEGVIKSLQLSDDELAVWPGQPLWVLIDDDNYVRRAFPAFDEAAIKRLVERTAILLPERKKEKPVVVRAPEK